MLEYIKSHKIVVAAAAFAVLILLILFMIIKTFFQGDEKAIYGDRLKGMDAVKITEKEQKELIKKLEDDSAVSKCTYSLQGKIINMVITVNDDVGVDTAKSLAGKTLEVLDEDQKKFFDIQVFIKKTNKATDFPIIGYKQNKKDGFSWTKDRAAS